MLPSVSFGQKRMAKQNTSRQREILWPRHCSNGFPFFLPSVRPFVRPARPFRPADFLLSPPPPPPSPSPSPSSPSSFTFIIDPHVHNQSRHGRNSHTLAKSSLLFPR